MLGVHLKILKVFFILFFQVNWSRILLCEATAAVLAACFDILGLKPVQKM